LRRRETSLPVCVLASSQTSSRSAPECLIARWRRHEGPWTALAHCSYVTSHYFFTSQRNSQTPRCPRDRRSHFLVFPRHSFLKYNSIDKAQSTRNFEVRGK
jgi:hypothetical protein